MFCWTPVLIHSRDVGAGYSVLGQWSLFFYYEAGFWLEEANGSGCLQHVQGNAFPCSWCFSTLFFASWDEDLFFSSACPWSFPMYTDEIRQKRTILGWVQKRGPTLNGTWSEQAGFNAIRNHRCGRTKAGLHDLCVSANPNAREDGCHQSVFSSSGTCFVHRWFSQTQNLCPENFKVVATRMRQGFCVKFKKKHPMNGTDWQIAFAMPTSAWLWNTPWVRAHVFPLCIFRPAFPFLPQEKVLEII